jgi:hypothetical protein
VFRGLSAIAEADNPWERRTTLGAPAPSAGQSPSTGLTTTRDFHSE